MVTFDNRATLKMASILYCGDSELTTAASYLAVLMTDWGWQFDYMPSCLPMSKARMEEPRSLIILSDYPANHFDSGCQQLALQQIEHGCGLLMIGGWESFHGLGGDWDGTKLGAALPVEIQSTDDRVNFAQSAWLVPSVDHPTVAKLPWFSNPPAIGGMNRVKAKPDSTIVLNAHSFAVSANPSPSGSNRVEPELSFDFRESLPALVVGQHGKGRTAAFLSDVAPHWIGGLVDWGTPRVTAQAGYRRIQTQTGNAATETLRKKKNSVEVCVDHEVHLTVEVGCHYAQFWKQLIEWTSGSPQP